MESVGLKGIGMNAFRMMMILSLAAGIAGAQDKPKPKAAAPAKPAAASKAAPAAASKGGAPSASKGGSAAASKGGPTTASKAGPTTGGGATPAGRGGATPAGRGPSTGGGATPARGGGATPRDTKTTVGDKHKPTATARTPASSHVTRTASGHEVTRRKDGRPADVRRGDTSIHHGLNGNRRVSRERADHSRVVADRRGHGYVQHPYRYHGHEYAHRTYYDHGRPVDRFYRGYEYHGVAVEAYAPAVYFAPAYYGWVYNPWVAPIQFNFGFAAAPWYGAYGFYFTPYPAYASASLWLTDYIISQQLAAAYAANAAMQSQVAAGGAAEGAVALTPDVKNLIAEEVKRQIALENQEAQTVAANNDPDPAMSGIGRLLSDGVQHTFVAGKDLDLVDANGNECAISEGDALQLTGPPAADATAANLVVLGSKGGNECRKGTNVLVAFEEIQEMQNAMRETIGQGMAELQKKQGTGGLPAAPASARVAPVQTAFAKEAPPPDADVQTQVNQELAAGDKAEQEVLKEAPADGAAPAEAAAPVTISLGQTVDEVTAILGPPKSIVELGPKKIYVYKDMKITFNSGKVTDVQ
jgi:hypothetical protein